MIKLSKRHFYLNDSVKSFGIRINKSLNWKHHVNDNARKLNLANALFYKSLTHIT